MSGTHAVVLVRDLPIIPLEAPIFFPGSVARVEVPDAGTAAFLARSVPAGERRPELQEVVLLARRTGRGEPDGNGLHEEGVAGLVEQVQALEGGTAQAVVRATGRVRVTELLASAGRPTARVEEVVEEETGSQREKALARALVNAFRETVGLTPGLRPEVADMAAQLERKPGRLVDFVVSGLDLKADERQAYLAEPRVLERLERAVRHLGAELEVLRLGQKIRDDLREEMGHSRREHLLREQMRAIQKELGEEEGDDVEELRQRLNKARLPDEARREADRELARLTQMQPGSAEGNVSRTYLDWMASLPWARSTRERLDVERARKVLEADHKGLEKIKERILDYVAVRQLRRESRGPILCLAGPPGVGKTSLGRSIARVLGRKFARISLGGVRDESEIRGHRRTYVGALPGRLIQALRKVGADNPVILLDEIDKLGADFRGDPAAALLEVLDPAQNATFTDHYLDVPFDLSKVLFVATANQVQAIPPALLDRMEVIELSGYTEAEKVAIAQGHLIPRQLRENGLARRRVAITDDAVERVIRRYTHEAGVRNLERELGAICRKLARTVAEGGRGPLRVTAEDVRLHLGPERRLEDGRADGPEPGLVAGLAWTSAGGEVMFVEATRMPGPGELKLTGKLGEVMRESAQIALSYVRSHAGDLGIDTDFSAEEVHVHLPAGAIPKDGPSGGVALATALVSLLTDTPVRDDVAMTGEVTLRGRVLPVGGIKEKVLAAHRAGMRTVVLPARNEPDLDELPDDVRRSLEIVLVNDVGQALEVSLARTDGAARQAA